MKKFTNIQKSEKYTIYRMLFLMYYKTSWKVVVTGVYNNNKT